MGRAPPRRGPSGSRPVSRILSWTVIHLPLTAVLAAIHGVGLQALRPTWDSAGSVIVPAWPCTGWGLPGRRVATPPVRSYRTISTLPATEKTIPVQPAEPSASGCEPRRLGGVFLWHFPAGFPGSVSRPPRPAVSGLSSSAGFLSGARDCLAGASMVRRGPPACQPCRSPPHSRALPAWRLPSAAVSAATCRSRRTGQPRRPRRA